MQTALEYRTNRDLFSNHYLDEQLPETEAWNATDEAEVGNVYEQLDRLYREQSDLAAEYDERRLRENLLDPAFELLGLTTAVEEPIDGEGPVPDYALFASERAREDAFERRSDGRDFHANALALADAKRWDRSLDGRGEREFTDPSFQIHASLDATGLDWGILTNGRRWRLYYGSTGHRLDAYYEIDLPSLLETCDPEEFKYFYLFFRREAFLDAETPSSGSADAVSTHFDADRPFVERVRRQSNVFAEQQSEDLRENVYEALRLLAEGFVTRDDDLGDEDLDRVYDASLTYLYRLIFVLYAESDGRDLLATDDDRYKRYSLDALKRGVAEQLDSPEPGYRECQTALWDRLTELFTVVDRGSAAQGIPEEDRSVPAYDGGLFETDPDAGETAAFLDSHAVGDRHLAQVVELLTRRESERDPTDDDPWVFVDYSSLDLRHLGSIYEGLLEYDLEIADQPLAGVREAGSQRWVPASEVANGSESAVVERVEPGDVYLTTETGERKTTGSYYTPEFVVEYVVENALDPLLDDVRADLDPDHPDYAERFAERVFDLSVLDPAMGSGHFLVETVEYLAREVVRAYRERARRSAPGPADADPPSVHWARRQVAEQCIYGVDENGMAVELTKVSLWLRTLAPEQSVAFLDNRLECGDSLAGTDVEAAVRDAVPSASLAECGATRADTDASLRSRRARARCARADADGLAPLPHRASSRSAPGDAFDDPVDASREFVAIENEPFSDVEERKRRYDENRRDDLRRRLTAMADVRAAERFGVDVPAGAGERMWRSLDDDREWAAVRETAWFREARRLADERDFFHWKLAFPEVFYDADGSPGDEVEAGFDAVVGNPPYVRSRNLPDDLKEYYRREFRTAEGAYDLYVPFVELAADLGERVSLVVPNKWTTTDYGRELRDLLLDDRRLREVLDASNLDVFPDADVYPVVLTCERDEASGGSAGDDSHEIRVRRPDDEDDLASAPTTAVSRSFVDRLGGRVVPLDLDSEFADVAADVLADCDRFGDHVTMSEGVHTGNVREKLLVEDPEGEGARRRKVVGGDSVGRYRLDWDGTWLRDDESLVERDEGEYANLRDPGLFEGGKLLVRDISDRPVAVYDDEDHYALNTLYSVRPRPESALSARYLLGVFNSAFVATYVRQVYGGTHVSGDYLRFKPMFAREIPVPDPAAVPPTVEPVEIAREAGVECEVPADPEAAVATLTERRREAGDERGALNCDLLDYLRDPTADGSAGGSASGGSGASGPKLAEVGVPVEGVGDSILAETASDRDGLRVGEVLVDDEDGVPVVSVTARYKPGGEAPDPEADREFVRETDRWGYVETDPVPAIRFPHLGSADGALGKRDGPFGEHAGTAAALVESFVPAAAERGEGFAGFRGTATKTNSLLDRLRALTLPDPERVEREVARCRAVRDRAAQLDARIEALEDAIDGVVYRLYGLDDEAVALVERLSERRGTTGRE